MIKAIIVGINAYTSNPLRGCINDATDVIQHLLSNNITSEDHIAPLYDGRATKSAIVSALESAIRSSTTGDHILFHYSGHGTRIPSSDHGDGYEEALVPVDYDWADMSSFISDRDLMAIAASVPNGIALTVVADSCHAGGLSRDLKQPRSETTARYLPPPADIQFLLRNRSTQVRQRALSPNALLIAACAANEEAADTVFGNRPNGAFTYFWLKELANKNDNVDSLVERVGSRLNDYSMHPYEDGPGALRAGAFLAPPVIARRSLSPSVRSDVVFDESWSTKVLGMSIGVQLTIAVAAAGLQFQVGSTAGAPVRWSFEVSGATTQKLDLGYGFSIILSVDNWSASASDYQFDIRIAVAPPFFPQVSVVQQHCTIPKVQLARTLTGPATPGDLLAMIQLSQLDTSHTSTDATHPPSISRDGDQWTGIAHVENFSGGLFGCSYNKNSNEGGGTSYVPPGFIRDHVEVVQDPPNAGNVHFNQWNDSDPHIGGFELHVGCNAFGGGKATFYLHCVRDPAVARDARGPSSIVVPVELTQAAGTSKTNGHSRSALEGLTTSERRPEAPGQA